MNNEEIRNVALEVYNGDRTFFTIKNVIQKAVEEAYEQGRRETQEECREEILYLKNALAIARLNADIERMEVPQ